MLRNLIDKIFYGGYEAASRKATARVVARYSRGNTSIQLGRYLNSAEMEKLQADGDKAAARLEARYKRITV